MKEFEAVIKWLEECQNESDGSWCEIDSGQKGIYLVKQKIVYTSQVIRAFAATGNQEKKCVDHGLSFLRSCEEIKDDGLYDFGLKFAPFHECGRTEIARSLAERVAAKQRSGGLWEFRRSGLPFFGVLFGLEILWEAGIKGFEVYIDRGIQFLIENQ